MIRRVPILPHLPERNAERLRRNMKEQERAAQKAVFANAQFAKDKDGKVDAVIDTTDTVLYHQLGAEPTGFLAVSPNGNATIWLRFKSKTTITLRASSAVTTKVVIF